MINISPSIASSNLLDIKNEIKKVENSDCYSLHIDIEDGNFVPNITFGIKLINLIRKETNMPISYHLMVTNPLFWIDELPLRNNDIVFMHVESYQYPKYIINTIKNKGVHSGIAFNPSTSIDNYKYLSAICDNIMIMTSEPDKNGDNFIEDMENKIIKAKEYNFNNIWVDGDINAQRIEKLSKIGVTNFVLGRYFFQKNNLRRIK